MVRLIAALALGMITQNLYGQSYFEDRPLRTFFGEVFAEKPVRSSVARVVMFSRDNCPPCDRWFANDRYSWEVQGWQVLRVKYNGPLSTPWFVVVEPKQATLVRGRLTHSTYLSSRRVTRIGRRWSYLDSIRDHLRLSHSVAAEGLSDSDLELLHDLLHEIE